MTLLSDITQRCRQIGRADEQAIDPIDSSDRLDVVQRQLALDLHQYANLVVGFGGVLRDAPPARRPRTAHASDPVRRIACGLDNRTCLLSRIHHRHQYRLHAQIQVLLDQRRAHVAVPARHPHHRVRVGVARHRLQLAQHAAQVVGCVLRVQQQPVKTRAGTNLGAVCAGQMHPQADLGSLVEQRLLETIDGIFHVSPLRIDYFLLCVGAVLKNGCRLLMRPS